MKKRGKVILAMSGGVDSSTAAAILKKNGYDVVGVFMRMHKRNNSKDAKKIAEILNIPFYVLDVQKEFKKRVVDYLIKEYRKGNTPNPCVDCNKHIKFKFLFDKLNKLKADYVATGHYARVNQKLKVKNQNYNSKYKIYKLLTAKDKTKDQSYFLWALTQKQLSKIIFTLGDYSKERVRGLAKKFKLPVLKKRESQEICFIDTCIGDFLKKHIEAKPGDIVTTDGRKIGKHKGLIFYTIGQRKRIEIGGTGPYYVVKKNFKKNALIVSNSQKDLLKKEMMVKNVNWLYLDPFAERNGFRCKVKIRSMAKMVPVTILNIQSSLLRVSFDKPQRAITPGQSAVFYLPAEALAKEGKRNELLGGGIIM